MIFRHFCSTAASIFLLIAGAPTGEGAGLPGEDPRLGDRIMVRVLPNAALADFTGLFESNHADLGVTLTPIDAIPSRQTHLLALGLRPQGSNHGVLDILEDDLDSNPAYRSILSWSEFCYQGEAPEGKTGSFWFSLDRDDGPFWGQFATGMFNLSQTHQRSRGAGTVVAVLDTGIDPAHPVLGGRLAAGGFNFVNGTSDTSDTGDGRDSDGDGFVDEMVGHGTFVASLIVLVAPDARILPVRVLDGDGVSDSWLIAKGLYHAIDQGVDVINLSLGSTYKSDAIGDALHEAREAGIIAVAAAGNLNRAEPREFPANTRQALGVAATDDLDVKAAFSNFHHKLTLAAPGANVLIQTPSGGVQYDLARSIVGAIPGGGYAIWQGTSFATAFVSGAAALIQAQLPDPGHGEATFDLIERRLASTAVDLSTQNPQFDDMLGAGRIDVARAVLLGAGDLDGDGLVAVADLMALLSAWGPCDECAADLDGDGVVGVQDLLVVMANWD